MNKVKVIIISHHHIPFGSSEDVFETYYSQNLKPLITSLYQIPYFSVVMHCSGTLFEWLERRHPELFMIFEELINRKQIELLGGGFYEPILPLISVTDKIGQIELLTTYIRKHFGKRPRGCWIPGLVWEQNFASVLNACGIDYTFVNHAQFTEVSMDSAFVSQAFITEDQGKLTTLFPVYRVTTPDEALAYLAQFKKKAALKNQKESILSMLLDIETQSEDGHEKYNPEIYINQIFKYLKDDSDTFELTLPIKYLKQDLTFSKTYLTGVNLRKTLVKHSEANGLYSKMIYVHTLINQLRGDKARKKNAREELWKAQGIDAFALDSAQGIQNNSIRNAMYRALIEAEKITREKGVFIPSILAFDFNLDGKIEYVIQGNELNCYVGLQGASIFELDYMPAATNYTDTFYVQDELPYPVPKRTSFVEYLCPPGCSLHEIISDSQHRNRFTGRELYQEESINKPHNTISFILEANQAEPFGNISIKKQYGLKKNTLMLTYTLMNKGSETERFTFLPHLEFSFSEFSTKAYQLFIARSGETKELDLDIHEVRNTEQVIYKDNKNDVLISIKSVVPFDAWQYQVFSPPSVYQSTCILPIQEILLTPGEQWETSFYVSFEKKQGKSALA
ncbi:alpha-amylase/4-alpha-glucanotransferase domain-containing protein [Gracilinema caldarium]|uniref:alpha-amylase/4-alpha-glucanotransferase domain-containing protein n=1 Tax=Gracilinema caldarium TaxID=215591 RepID=UPI0026E96BEF|nr:alpha-amylase/4-alpha-glucanotransferase domain-containing protein [Gracilinema caldarium]